MKRRIVVAAAAVTVVIGGGVAVALLNQQVAGGNPLIVVPGILAVWPEEDLGIMTSTSVIGAKVVEPKFHSIEGTVEAWYPSGTLPDLGWRSFYVYEDYDGWKAELTTQRNGYVPGVSLFLFPYWGLDSVALSAFELGRLVDYVLERTSADKVDIVAHSMGGVVARAYASSPVSVGKVDQLITFGTPHHGAPAAYTAWEGGTVERFFDLTIKDEVFAEALEEYLGVQAQAAGFNRWYNREDPTGIAAYLHEKAPGVRDLLSTDPYIWDWEAEDPRPRPCSDTNAYPVNTYLCGLFDRDKIENLSETRFVSAFVTSKATDYGYRIPSWSGIDLSRPLWPHGDPQLVYGIFEIGELGMPLLDEWDKDVEMYAEIGQGDGKIPAASSMMAEEMFEITGRSDWAVDCDLERDLVHGKLGSEETASELVRILRGDMCTGGEASPPPRPEPALTTPPAAPPDNAPPELKMRVCVISTRGVEDCIGRDQRLTIDLSIDPNLVLRFDASGSNDPDGWTVVWSIGGRTASTSPLFFWDPTVLTPGDNAVLLEESDVHGAVSSAGTTVHYIPPTVGAPTPANEAPMARLRICSADGECVGNGGTLVVDPDSGDISFDALSTEAPSTDPDGDPLGFEWMINGPPVVTPQPSFIFNPAELNPGPNSVLLRAGDDKAAVSEARATVIVTAEICEETVQGPLGELGSQTVEGPPAGPGVVSRVELVGESDGDPVWQMSMELYDSTGALLHTVDGIERATLFGVTEPLTRGAILDATGDLRPDVVACFGGTFNGGFDVKVLVVSDHSGRWQTVLDETAVNAVALVATPQVEITQTVWSMLGACTDLTRRIYEFERTFFRFVSQETSHDWTIPECDPEYEPPIEANPYDMVIGWTDYGARPGETLTVEAPADEGSNVGFAAVACVGSCDFLTWYIDGQEVGRGAYVYVPVAAIPAGTHEVLLRAEPPGGAVWEGTVILERVHS